MAGSVVNAGLHGIAHKAAQLAYAKAFSAPLTALQAARGAHLPLIALAFGSGVGLWFGLSADLSRSGAMLLLGLALALLRARAYMPLLWQPPAALALALTLGIVAAELRAQLQAAPVLGFRYYGAISGRIIEIDRSSRDALRLTLDQPQLERLAPDQTPQRLRISLLTPPQFLRPEPGQRVMVTGFLGPPAGPAEPGGFDFQRMAYFERLGAVGYSRNPLLLLEPAQDGDAVFARLRRYFSAVIQAQIPGEAGAFAAGAMTGDRSGISQATVATLRDSSLAHILAISGMNLACLSGFVFALIRGGIALVPWLALRLQAKKLAALASLPVAWVYLQLSGGNLATERAFIMICVMLGAIMLDRRAITLRSAAIAALVMLALRPESLMAPGFQMSMAATIGLITGFAGVERWSTRRAWPRWLLPIWAAVLSTLIGGLATAPYAAAHFNRFAEYGFLANLLTVPVMGMAIMPMGVLALLLAPLGLAFVPLWLMGRASAWILYVAQLIAGLDGAVLAIPAPHWAVLPLFSAAAAWAVIWPGRARLLGGFGAVLALTLWPLSPRPAVLIAEDAALAGVEGPQGRSLSSGRGNGISAQTWLERDGDLIAQHQAAKRPGFARQAGGTGFALGRAKILMLRGKAGIAALAQACPVFDAIFLHADPRLLRQAAGSYPAHCPLITARDLQASGALSLSWHADAVRVTPARRKRIWAGAGVTSAAPGADWLLPAGFFWSDAAQPLDGLDQ